MATSRYRRRKGRRSPLKTVVLVLLMVLLPLLSLGGGGFLAYQHLNTEQMDANGCYARPDQHQTAFFVDFSFTGSTSGSQQRDLKNALLQTYGSMPANGALSVFTTESSSTATVNAPVFVICKPARNAAEQERIDAPGISAPKLARLGEDAQDRVARFIDEMIDSSAQPANMARNSPILEQLQGISRYDFGAPLSQLVAYTDGLNMSPAGQFCAKQGELPTFAKYAERPGYRFVEPESFNGAAIEILMVAHGDLPSSTLAYCTTQELRTFWVDYFEANGAGAVTLTPLSYGAGD